MPSFDAVVVGAGHNGLVTAAYLARAGLKTIVLERRDRVGGALELAHTVGRLAPSVVRDLRLHAHGLRLIEPPVRVFAPRPDGGSLTLWSDVARNRDEVRPWSGADAVAFYGFDRRVRALSGFVAHMQALTPPDLTDPSLRDGLGALKLARALRGLDADDVETLLRALPMAVADFVAESFESEPLRAVAAWRGVQYTAMGPWSAGTTAILLADAANNGGGAAGQSTFARGGAGAVASALESAARAFGAEIRTSAEVAGVTSSEGRVTGVVLDGGEEIGSSTVASGADPKRTLLDLVDPVELGPSLRWRAGNLRAPGAVAKVEMLLEGVPRFRSCEGEERLHGRILLAPEIDAIERAFDATKYGRIADPPCLEVAIPSLADDTLVAQGRHVASVLVQYAPYHLRDGTWEGRRDELGDLVLRTLDDYAPGFADLVVERRVITPMDLERDFGLTEGHPLHLEPSLDQFFAWRPLFGHASYRLVPEGLYLCGSGAHPGGGVTGGPGANAAREIYNDWVRRSRG